jgi:hypothetical protein
LPLTEIAGPILASLAVILSILVFKKTLDYQAYREMDSNYMEVLKLGMENPFLRDKKWIQNPFNRGPLSNRDQVLKYDQYAYMVWNICETIFDRKKVDRTWTPVIRTEKELHKEWLQNNESKFKPEFLKFIYDNDFSNKDNVHKIQICMKIRSVVYYALICVISPIAIFYSSLVYSDFPVLYRSVEYFDNSVELQCAHDPTGFNVTHPYDCAKFTAGSIAELCVLDYDSFGLKDKSGCSKFIQPMEIVE